MQTSAITKSDLLDAIKRHKIELEKTSKQESIKETLAQVSADEAIINTSPGDDINQMRHLACSKIEKKAKMISIISASVSASSLIAAIVLESLYGAPYSESTFTEMIPGIALATMFWGGIAGVVKGIKMGKNAPKAASQLTDALNRWEKIIIAKQQTPDIKTA